MLPSHQRGFTLLELMITLLIFATISAFSYNPLVEMYQRQKAQSHAQALISQLKVARQQAMATQQKIHIDFALSGSGKNLTVTQTNTRDLSVNTWFTQNNLSSASIQADGVNITRLVVTEQGNWLHSSNQIINRNFLMRYDIYGVRILPNGLIEKCQTEGISSDNLSKIKTCT